MDRPTLARIAVLYLPLCLTATAWLLAPPSRRERAAAFLATAWNVPALLAVHVAAMKYGWWSYSPVEGTLAGLPVDLYIGWAVLWGALPALATRRVPVLVVALSAVAVDLVAMPQLSPVVQLGDSWLVGEAFAIVVCLVPAQWLAIWTREDTHVTYRAF